MGHLKSFSTSGGGKWTKIFQKFKCPGGMYKLRFDWYISVERVDCDLVNVVSSNLSAFKSNAMLKSVALSFFS